MSYQNRGQGWFPAHHLSGWGLLVAGASTQVSRSHFGKTVSSSRVVFLIARHLLFTVDAGDKFPNYLMRRSTPRSWGRRRRPPDPDSANRCERFPNATSRASQANDGNGNRCTRACLRSKTSSVALLPISFFAFGPVCLADGGLKSCRHETHVLFKGTPTSHDLSVRPTRTPNMSIHEHVLTMLTRSKSKLHEIIPT